MTKNVAVCSALVNTMHILLRDSIMKRNEMHRREIVRACPERLARSVASLRFMFSSTLKDLFRIERLPKEGHLYKTTPYNLSYFKINNCQNLLQSVAWRLLIEQIFWEKEIYQ